MLHRIFISFCLLSVVVSSAMSASFSTSCKCSTKIEKCPKLKCPPGSLPVENPCKGCCRMCGKTEGEECGGVNDIYGRCSPDLKCQPGLFTFSKLNNLKGTCSKLLGFDMTADFLKLDDLQDDLWDKWEFSFASSEAKEIYNVFDVLDVSEDFLKPEDTKQELWEGWEFSFSSDQQSANNKMSDFDKDFRPKEESSTNEIWGEWPFSFSSGGGFSLSEIDSQNSESSNVEGSGSFYNNINALEYPPF